MMQQGKSLVLFCIIATGLSAKLPPQFGRCKKADLECLKKSAEDAILKSGQGIKELRVPKFEPFGISSVLIEQRPGPISLSQNYTNIQFNGLSQIRVLKISMNLDPDNCNLYLEMLTPKFTGSAHYSMEGQILTLPIKTDGQLEVIHEDFVHGNNITCEIYQKKGDDYLRITDIKPEFKFGPVTVHMGEMFKGNPELSKQIEKTINDDPLVWLHTVLPEFKNIWKQVIQLEANGFFSHVPLKEIFVDY